MAQNFTEVKNLHFWLFEDPPKHLPFEFEKSLDVYVVQTFAKVNWPYVAAICFIYCLLVQYGPTWMKKRKPLKLQKSLVAWNFCLAVFSICGTLRTAPTTLSALSQPNRFHATFCERNGLSQPTVFWSVLFSISKFFEFGDTVFIILRKRPLIFLHWFHHLTVCFYMFLSLSDSEPIFYFGVVINYFIHSIMYTYYTLMALKIKIPKKIAMIITTSQILQFVAYLSISLYTCSVMVSGGKCARSWTAFAIQTTIGFVFLALFMQVFYKSYISKSKEKTQ